MAKKKKPCKHGARVRKGARAGLCPRKKYPRSSKRSNVAANYASSISRGHSYPSANEAYGHEKYMDGLRGPRHRRRAKR